MDRAQATGRLEGVLRILAGAADEPLRRVTACYVFGSYARGALVVGDIDVDVEYEIDEERALYEVRQLSSGRSAHGDLRRALFGGQRIFQPHFRSHAELEGELGGLALLWERGDAFEVAAERLARLVADPTAGRADRDPVAPSLQGLERWIARGDRTMLTEAVEAGALAIEQVELPDGRPHDPETLESIEDRWGETNPLRRAGLAAAAYLESLGIEGATAWYRGWGSMSAADGRVMVNFGSRGIDDSVQYLGGGHGDLWLQVVRPTRHWRLRALVMRPARRAKGAG